MVCPTCRFNDPPGFLKNGVALEPCPDCGGTMVAHCCDVLTACNDSVDEAMAADAADDRPKCRMAEARLWLPESPGAGDNRARSSEMRALIDAFSKERGPRFP